MSRVPHTRNFGLELAINLNRPSAAVIGKKKNISRMNINIYNDKFAAIST
jgi:hypothetical protein